MESGVVWAGLTATGRIAQAPSSHREQLRHVGRHAGSPERSRPVVSRSARATINRHDRAEASCTAVTWLLIGSRATLTRVTVGRARMVAVLLAIARATVASHRPREHGEVTMSDVCSVNWHRGPVRSPSNPLGFDAQVLGYNALYFVQLALQETGTFGAGFELVQVLSRDVETRGELHKGLCARRGQCQCPSAETVHVRGRRPDWRSRRYRQRP